MSMINENLVKRTKFAIDQLHKMMMDDQNNYDMYVYGISVLSQHLLDLQRDPVWDELKGGR